ncbi:MAG TPA: hypothetical protein VFJ43_06685 [Bacteroidia bacterium]|nr:hypothetical protein [Bacteroidia bacterium]
MERLSKDWITEKHIDFEYKKYVLLAYLQHVSDCFKTVKLYPALADLIEHYKTAKSIKENKQELSSHFPQRIKGISEEQFRIQYEKVVNDDRLMLELESILDFSLLKFAGSLNEGKQIYDFLENEIHLQSVGLRPIDASAGYLFLKDRSAQTQVFNFTVTLFEQPDSTWRGINTRFIRTYSSSLLHTYNAIKSELIFENRSLPNPAVFAAETGLTIPLNETFLPIAKRMLIREVSIQAA